MPSAGDRSVEQVRRRQQWLEVAAEDRLRPSLEGAEELAERRVVAQLLGRVTVDALDHVHGADVVLLAQVAARAVHVERDTALGSLRRLDVHALGQCQGICCATQLDRRRHSMNGDVRGAEHHPEMVRLASDPSSTISSVEQPTSVAGLVGSRGLGGAQKMQPAEHCQARLVWLLHVRLEVLDCTPDDAHGVLGLAPGRQDHGQVPRCRRREVRIIGVECAGHGPIGRHHRQLMLVDPLGPRAGELVELARQPQRPAVLLTISAAQPHLDVPNETRQLLPNQVVAKGRRLLPAPPRSLDGLVQIIKIRQVAVRLAIHHGCMNAGHGRVVRPTVWHDGERHACQFAQVLDPQHTPELNELREARNRSLPRLDLLHHGQRDADQASQLFLGQTTTSAVTGNALAD